MASTKIEINRYFASPKTFYEYCKRRLGDHANDWIDDYDTWINPITPSNMRNRDETCVLKPYETHLYYRDSYNFIMEYDFFDDTHGFGYLYLAEYAEDEEV